MLHFQVWLQQILGRYGELSGGLTVADSGSGFQAAYLQEVKWQCQKENKNRQRVQPVQLAYLELWQ